MKVLIFTTQLYQIGGAERLAVELAQNLNRLGTHSEVLSQYSAVEPGVAQAVARLKTAGVPTVHFLGLETGPSILDVIRAVKRFRGLIKSEKYDVIETSGFGPSLIAALASVGGRSRQIVGIHDQYTSRYYGNLKHWLWKRVLKLSSSIRFYAISSAAGNDWVEYSGVSPSRVSVVTNSINEEYFNAVSDPKGVRNELGIDGEARVVLFVGRLLKRKGIDTLFHAILPILCDYDLYVLYIGREHSPEGIFEGENVLLEELRATQRMHFAGERIRFLGERRDVPRLMASSDLLVHPARIEGFGLVLAEALATGLPIIASNVGGIPEVLKETDSVLVPPDDAVALRGAIESTLRWAPERRAEAVRLGRLRAESFRGATRAQRMLRLYEAAVQDDG